MIFSSVYTILYAFARHDGSLDEDAMRRQVRACLASGAHGIAILGLTTEVARLTGDERRAIIAWTAEEIAGRVPLAATVAGPDIDSQIAFARDAAKLGARWLVFQPPENCNDERELLQAFGRAADAVDVPFGIQNAPQFLGVGLSAASISALHRNHSNFTVLKREAPATEIEQVVEACGETLSVLNGRGGLELTDILRAGCGGIIPAPECCDIQVRIYNAMARGDDLLADELHRRLVVAIDAEAGSAGFEGFRFLAHAQMNGGTREGVGDFAGVDLLGIKERFDGFFELVLAGEQEAEVIVGTIMAGSYLHNLAQ